MTIIDITLKRCCRKEKCINPLGSWLPSTVEYFRQLKKGLHSSCWMCERAYARQYRLDHLEKMRKQARENTRRNRASHLEESRAKERKWKREYAKKHPEKMREWKLAYCEAHRPQEAARASRYYHAHRDEQYAKNKTYSESHRDESRARARQYAKTHPARIKAYRANRRALELSAPGSHTHADIELQLRSQKGKCWHCGKVVNNDWHVDHLIPLSRGGSNAPENLVVSCPSCNLSKNDKLTQEWNGKLF